MRPKAPGCILECQRRSTWAAPLASKLPPLTTRREEEDSAKPTTQFKKAFFFTNEDGRGVRVPHDDALVVRWQLG